jgi:hypothetical protein
MPYYCSLDAILLFTGCHILKIWMSYYCSLDVIFLKSCLCVSDYPLPKFSHAATSNHHPHLPHSHSPHQPHYPTPPPTAPRRTPSPPGMEVDEDVKPKIEEPTSPHPTEQQLLHELYKQVPEKSTPQTQYNTKTAVGNLSVKNHEYPGVKVTEPAEKGEFVARGCAGPRPYSDLKLQGPETMLYDLRMKGQGHPGQGHNPGQGHQGHTGQVHHPGQGHQGHPGQGHQEYSMYGPQSSSQPFSMYNPSLGAEQNMPYDLSARVNQGSRSQPPQPQPVTQPIQVKEEPMDYYDHYQQHHYQQQEVPIDYTQKNKAVNSHPGHFPTPIPTPIPTPHPQHHNGQTTVSSNQSSSEEDSKAFQRQSATRRSYPPLKSPEPRDRDSDTPSKVSMEKSSSAKDPMEHAGFSKGKKLLDRCISSLQTG